MPFLVVSLSLAGQMHVGACSDTPHLHPNTTCSPPALPCGPAPPNAPHWQVPHPPVSSSPLIHHWKTDWPCLPVHSRDCAESFSKLYLERALQMSAATVAIPVIADSPAEGSPCPPACLQQSWLSHNRGVHTAHTGTPLECLVLVIREYYTSGHYRIPTT